MHEDSIKQKVVNSFILDKKRAPTQQELKAIYNQYIVDNPSAINTGLLSGNKQSFSLTRSESSSSIQNKLNYNLKLDLNSLLNETKKQKNEIEHKFRNYFQKLDRSLKELKKVERNINRNLLLFSKDDIFIYGITESFDDYNKVDFQKSTINFFNGKATLNFSSITKPSKDLLNLTYSLRSLNGNITNRREVNSIKNSMYEDGTFFKVISYSSIPDDTIDLIITIDLSDKENKYIDTIKIVTAAIEKNSKMSYRCFYSEDKNTYSEAFESNLRIEENEIFIEINKNNLKEIKIILSKNHSDYKDGNQYAYAFVLDYIGLIEKTFNLNTESVLYLGPYEIVDENDEKINFSMATLKGGTCCIVPDKSSINFYLSKDNSEWHSISFDGTGKEIIQFDSFETDLNDTLFDVIDLNSENIFIAESIDETNIILNENEYLLNFYINSENINKLIKNSLSIERNHSNKDLNIKLYGSDSGWLKEDNFYYCNIKIVQPEGRYINFGNKSCFINERQVNGKVHIPYGTHTFKTNEENYYKIKEEELNINNAKQLKKIDRLYPYNHKYLIEGFNYNPDFIGRQVYSGADEVFAFNLKEVSNQRFILENNLDIFTIIENEVGLFFKIYSKERSSEIKFEEFKVNCKKRNTNVDNNLLYIKAVLNSSDEKVTPKIDQIQVRVI